MATIRCNAREAGPLRILLKLLAVLWLFGLGNGAPARAQGQPAPAPAAPTAPTAPNAAPTAPSLPSLPQLVLPPEAQEVERLAKSIESAELAIKQLKELEGELSRLRNEVERIIYDSTATAESLRPQLDEVRKQIQRLGPPPAKDKPPESPTVAAERLRLDALASHLDGAIKTTELAWVRAKQLIDRITVIRYQLFTRNLLERRDSPLLPGVWKGVFDRGDSIIGRIGYYGDDWLTWAGRVKGYLAALVVAIAAVYLGLGSFVRRFIAGRLGRPEPSPSFFQRAAQAAWVAPLRMLAPGAAVLMLYFGLASLDLLFSPWMGLATETLAGLLMYVASSSLLRTSLAPHHPQWRLIPLADASARRVLLILLAFVAVYVIDIMLVEIGRAVYVPLTVTIAQSFVSSLAFALLLALLILTPFAPQTGPDRPVNGHAFVPKPVRLLSPLWIKLPLLVTLGLVIISSLLGYIALGRFVAHQVVQSGTVLAAGGLLYLAVRAATRGRADNADGVGQVLERRFGLTDPSRRRQLSRLLEVILTLLIGMLAMPLLLAQWGFSGADIRDWAKALLFGFEIGQFRISLARILIGIGLFTALLFLTRVLQRWLRDNVMVQPRVDAGIANSVDTAIGYAGIGLALLIALSYAGLDITSLAIVAGALSVGIGFGLQSIVNNFVSGLILLVERPIKVGDWIVVGNEQGNVRRISVRSTEIETFDRASLIIPNSELIAGRVLNWTHRNPLGRAVVKVQVAPSADPEKVLAILRACAAGCPEAHPGTTPIITFDDFNSQMLQFTVRIVVGDVYASSNVATRLRIAILKRFREDGIETSPNLQADVHLRDLDWVRSAAARVAESRAGEPPGSATADQSRGPSTS